MQEVECAAEGGPTNLRCAHPQNGEVEVGRARLQLLPMTLLSLQSCRRSRNWLSIFGRPTSYEWTDLGIIETDRVQNGDLYPGRFGFCWKGEPDFAKGPQFAQAPLQQQSMVFRAEAI